MASTSIDKAFVKQYGSNINLLAQIKGGVFEGKCEESVIQGEEKYLDNLGNIVANEVTNRFADSPEGDIAHDRRRVIATPYDTGIGLDKFDQVQMLINPESAYISQMVYGLKRKKSIEFLKGALGTAQSGKGGGTANPVTGCPTVPVATGDTGSTGMNLAKLQFAKYQLENGNVDLSDPMNKPYFAWGPKQKYELLTNTTVTSSDYADIKALVRGDITNFYGMEFIDCNQIPYINTAGTGVSLDWTNDAPVDTDSTDIRACFAYTKSAVHQATNPDIKSEVSKRADKSFNWYAYACLRTGAARLEEAKLVMVPCDESP